MEWASVTESSPPSQNTEAAFGTPEAAGTQNPGGAASVRVVLSIIIPAYNIAPFAHRCLASIRDLEESRLEVIVVDDGSTDETLAICQRSAQSDPRIVIHSQANSGLSEARNVGLQLARGEYLAFVDGDDYISAHAMSTALGEAVRLDADIVVGGAYLVDSSGRVLSVRNPAEIRGNTAAGAEYMEEALARKALRMCAPYNLYSRALIAENVLFFKPGIYHEDELWTPQVLLAARRVVRAPSPFYFHVQRSGSIMTGTSKTQRARDLLSVVDSLTPIVDGLPKGRLRDLLNDNLVALFLNAIYVGAIITNRPAWSKPMLRLLRRARTPRNKLRAVLYVTSPSIYVAANRASKGLTQLVSGPAELLKSTRVKARREKEAAS